MMERRVEILQFVKNELMNGHAGIELTEQTELIQSGVIDSLGIMKLLSFLEERFKANIPPDHLLPENFESVEKINHLIESLKS